MFPNDFPTVHSSPEAHIALVRALLNGNRSDAELRSIGRMRLTVAQRSLSDDAVLEIRQRAATGERHRALAIAYGVAQSVIWTIVNGRTYREVA